LAATLEQEHSDFPAPALDMTIAKRKHGSVLMPARRHVHPGVVRRIAHRELPIIDAVVILVRLNETAVRRGIPISESLIL